jgi:transposase
VERLFWVVLSKVVKPATVIAWHQRFSRGYWRWRSRRPGRPRIADDHIALIRRITSENPQWGEDKIAEELAVKLGVPCVPTWVRQAPPPRLLKKLSWARLA